MKMIAFKIDIAAPRQKVWSAMLEPKTYNEWSGAAWPGSYVEGQWQEGATLRFVGPDGSGTLVKLMDHRPYEYILAKHIAILLKGGAEDRDSPEAKNWIGTTESYTFSGTANGTALKIAIQTAPDFENMFNDGWPKALAKLKEICER